MSAEQNKAAALRFWEEGFGKGNLGIVDELMTASPVDHTPFPGVPAGREGYKQTMSMIRAAFPDMTIRTDETIADGDRVVLRWTARGSHRGDFMGVPASGKPFEISGISILLMEGGKVAGDWTQWDALGLMTQIGAIPEPARA